MLGEDDLFMDNTDKKILALLQEDAAQPVADIARKVGMSVTPCWRRIQKLQEDGSSAPVLRFLTGQRLASACLCLWPSKQISIIQVGWLNFAAQITKHIEVVEFYRMSGEVDYLLRVVVPDMAAYDRFYKKLISEVKLTDVSSSFAMEQIKYTTALPLDEIEAFRS